MPTITTKDGTQIYYKDWGNGMCSTLKDRVNAELLTFFQQGKEATAANYS